MFCPSCGTQVPDSAAFCGSCGHKFGSDAAQAPQQPQAPQQVPQQSEVQAPAENAQPAFQPTASQQAPYEPPVFQPNAAQQAPQQPPVFQASAAQQAPYQPPVFQAPQPSKAEAIITPAEKNARWGCLATFLLALALLITSVFVPLNNDLLANDFIKFCIQLVDPKATVRDVRDQVVEGIEEAEESLEAAEEQLTDSQKEAIEKFLTVSKKLVKNFSILNLREFATTSLDAYEELENATNFGYEFNISKSDITMYRDFIDVAIYVVAGLFLIPLLLLLLAGLFRSKGLTITAIIPTVLVQIIFCGVLWVLLTLVIYIAHAVFCSLNKKAKLKRKIINAL